MLIAITLVGQTAFGQDAKFQKAMAITPKQGGVDYERPGVAILKACKFVEKKTKPVGFVVHHESGRILRQFLDTNGDGKLNVWSYFKDGIEVYRDIDTNGDSVADQYRWLADAGTRWGIDKNQDGTIDTWKVISPEEVAYECFEAIKNLNQERFNRLLLTQEEYASLQLGPRIAKDVQVRWQKAKANFLSMARSQKVINSRAKWVYAGNGQAAMSPAGSHNNKRDLVVYNHGSGFFDAPGAGGVRQLGIGSVIKVGDVWRLIELPEVVDPKKPLGNGGAFFPMPEFGTPSTTGSGNAEMVALHESLAKTEKALETASGAAAAKLEKQKADILVKFYRLSKEKKMKRDWLENLADSVSSAYQANRYDGGLEYLDTFVKANKTSEGMDYVKWRAIFADYGWTNIHGVKKDRDAGYEKLIVNLTAFQRDFPKSKFTADALVQLAVHNEVRNTDEPEKAAKWYAQCKQRFPNTTFGRRSAGALVRLNGPGANTAIGFKGKTFDGKIFDLQRYRGKIVVIHYWETWCANGFEDLVKVESKFDDVVVVSCNIEQETGKLKEWLGKNKEKLPKILLHEPGTVDDSPLAHQLGIATEPMVLLIDKNGKLVAANIAFGDLEREVVRERRR